MGICCIYHSMDFNTWLRNFIDRKATCLMTKRLGIYAQIQATLLTSEPEELEADLKKIVCAHLTDPQHCLIAIISQFKSACQLRQIKSDYDRNEEDGEGHPDYWREAQEIKPIPGLYLGPHTPAKNWDWLQAHGITHILTVGSHMFPSFKDKLTYKIIEAWDCDDQNLLKHFEESNQFIETALQTGHVLVHCAAGISRSTTMVCAYLMKTLQVNPADALEIVRHFRPYAEPNPGFMKQLVQYNELLCKNRLNK